MINKFLVYDLQSVVKELHLKKFLKDWLTADLENTEEAVSPFCLLWGLAPYLSTPALCIWRGSSGHTGDTSNKGVLSLP